MQNQTIINHETSTINAIGNYNSSHCKPVVCKETMVVYSSITDAAKGIGCHLSHMSDHLRKPEKYKSVHGMHFVYLKDVLDDPNVVLEDARNILSKLAAETQRANANEAAANKWREYQAQLKAEAEAEAKRLKEAAKREKKRAKLEEDIRNLTAKRDSENAKLEAIEAKRSKAAAKLANIDSKLIAARAELDAMNNPEG